MRCTWDCAVSHVGDNVCDKDCYNKRCLWDGGDCVVSDCAPGCIDSWLGDGYCHLACFTESCDWDLGDCE